MPVQLFSFPLMSFFSSFYNWFYTGKNGGEVQGMYINGADKLFLTDGSAVGVRSDYNGVLLLDTILQPTVNKSDDIVRLELLLTEVSFQNFKLYAYCCKIFSYLFF